MFHQQTYTGSRPEQYDTVISQLHSLIEGESNAIANLANAAALLGSFLQEINWAGFYLYDGQELVLGPFQGLPACIRIPLNKGVCGAAAQERKTMVVEDVHAFPGHIACDAATNSEIVIPMFKDGHLLGVLDIDSPLHGRFDDTDREYLEKFVQVLVQALPLPN
ncbi:GAF domain-containing protein [Paenibacillus shirakamiensis]|uniref:GAF domain-containing protein n=1 Tax=Paenibacillus shirakamiensis TaxID=1265935 RepID=A0ABS4JJ04_9BACL|nr:GAF domain-containing protein [Paenibacillus shirakamiensis]MBP2001678.1 GAF domain-containing protein [Paenibacillus shirakamiensis]